MFKREKAQAAPRVICHGVTPAHDASQPRSAYNAQRRRARPLATSDDRHATERAYSSRNAERRVNTATAPWKNHLVATGRLAQNARMPDHFTTSYLKDSLGL